MLQVTATIWLSGQYPCKAILKERFRGNLVNTSSPATNTVFSSNIFNNRKTQYKLCAGLGIRKSLHIGSRFTDMQHYQVSCISTYWKEFPQHNSPQWLWRALPTNIPTQVFKPVKNNFLATLLKSCSKASP